MGSHGVPLWKTVSLAIIHLAERRSEQSTRCSSWRTAAPRRRRPRSFAMLKIGVGNRDERQRRRCTPRPHGWRARRTPRVDAMTRLYSNDIDVGPLVTDTIFFPPYAIGQAIAMAADLVDAYGRDNTHRRSSRSPSAHEALPAARPALGPTVRRRSPLGGVSLDSGAIRYITRHGRVVETDGRSVCGPNPNACHTERNVYNAAMNAKAAASQAREAVDHSLKREARQEYAKRPRPRRRRPPSTAVSWPLRQPERRTSSPSTWSMARSHRRRYRAPSRPSC